jgi:hypothetical protein
VALKVKAWRLTGWLLVGFLTACSSGEVVTPLPTQILIPVTVTFTPEPAQPTDTPTPSTLINPGDVVTPTAEPGSATIPVAAQPFVQLAVDDLAVRLTVSESAIDLLQLEAATWTSIDLGCGDTSVPALAGLEIDGYRVILSYSGQRYEYHTDTNASVRLCSGERQVVGRVEGLLVESDPLAANLAATAQTRLARELDLPTRRIQIVDVQAFTWADSSLGCPAAGQTYTAVSVPGYRIVLAAGDQQYIFHSDSTQLIACPLGDEVLP